MKLVTVFFDSAENDKYEKLYRVFEESVKRNASSQVKFIGVKLPVPNLKLHPVKACVANTVKLKEWIRQSRGSENVCLIDCDMLLLKDIQGAFDEDFDIAFTKRLDTCRLRINAGVVFVKPTKEAQEFLELWYRINVMLLNDQVLHRPWREKYGGMNQAALGYILENCTYSAKIAFLPCAEWNACDDNWVGVDEKTKLVHIKGRLRRACFNEYPVAPDISKLHNYWMEIKNSLFD